MKLRRKEVQQYHGGMHLISLLVIAMAMITLIIWSGNYGQEMWPDEPIWTNPLLYTTVGVTLMQLLQAVYDYRFAENRNVPVFSFCMVGLLAILFSTILFLTG
nr:DUF4181 domain-containing protein [Alkalicoccus luteus]